VAEPSEAERAARELCVECGVIDPPALFVLALAGMRNEADRRELIATSGDAIRRLKVMEQPFGRLSLLIQDIVAPEAADLFRSRVQRRAREEMQ
jgi:hypothetical protein